MSKKFKTFDEQIKLLEQKELFIKDKNRLKWYLQSYNYQNFINGYNDFFMINNDRNKNKYKKTASSDGIIELFNFDRLISKYILSSIQNIERMASTALAYTIAKIMNDNQLDHGKIFSIKDEDILIKKIFIINEYGNKFTDIKKRFKKTFEDNNDKCKNIFSKYNNFVDIPIWTLIINATFGNIIFFLNGLKPNIFFNVIKNSNLKNIKNLSKGEIITLFTILKEIRNRICHNNVLYNISLVDESKRSVIKKIIGKTSLRSSKFKLYEIVKSIERIDSNTKGELSKLISEKFDNFKYVDIDILKEIRQNIWDKN